MTLLEDIIVDIGNPVRMCADAVAPGSDGLVAEVLASGQLAAGPKVAAFERECAAMAGTDHAVAVTNGTVSLELLLSALGIGPGDEVIVPAFTFAASASAVLRVGATVRLVDIDATGTIDVEAARDALSDRTAAVMAVHLYGLPADLRALTDLCTTHGLALIEDAAQAHGATVDGRPVGGWGHGSFSFYATKNVSCGEGGAVTTDDRATAERIRLLRNQGMTRRHHHKAVGTNQRMSELHAALGLASMARRRENADRRRANAERLSAGLVDTSLDLPFTRPGSDHAWHQYTVTHRDRDDIATALALQSIETGVHYPRPIHRQPAFAAHQNVLAGPCPTAYRFAATCLSLPVHHGLTDRDVDRIVVATRRAVEVAQ